MKTLLNRTNGAWRITGALLFAASLAAASLLSSCKSDPQSANGPNLPLAQGGNGGSGGGSSTAHPAWTYPRIVSGRNNSYYAVQVSDSDGTNSANVYTSTSTTVRTLSPTWSPNGASVSFAEGPTTATGTWTIKAVDVSVNSNGVAVGSNVRTILSSTSLHIYAQAWSQNSSVAKIAFVAKSSSGYGIYTVSTSGGTPTLLYSASSGDGMGVWIAWSNDGTQISFLYVTGSAHTQSIRVIDASTGAEDADLVSGNYYNINGIVWSHSGLDEIAFSATTVSGGNNTTYKVYTITPTNGSTESFVANGSGSFWSPNNSEMVFSSANTSPVTQKVILATGGTTSVGSGIPYGDWKQPS